MHKNLFVILNGTVDRGHLLATQPESFTELGKRVKTQLLEQDVSLTPETMVGFRPSTAAAHLSSLYFTRGFQQDISYFTEPYLEPNSKNIFRLPLSRQPDTYSIMQFLSTTYRKHDNVVIFAGEEIFQEVLPRLLKERLNVQNLINTDILIGEMVHVYGNLKKRQNVDYEIISGFHHQDGGRIIPLSPSILQYTAQDKEDFLKQDA